MSHRLRRSRERGAIIVEAVVVISIFILFFVGMMYFESLYHNRLRIGQLARAGAVAYAMSACAEGSGALDLLRRDLGNATGGNGASPSAPSATVPVGAPSKPIGNGGDPLGNALSRRGLSMDKITDVTLSVHVATGARSGLATRSAPRFQTTVTSSSFMSCGDKQEKGDASSVWDYVKTSFNSLW